MGALASVAACASLSLPLAAQDARAAVHPGNLQQPAGAEIAGTVGWRSSPNLLALTSDLGVGASPYRRMAFVHDLGSYRYIGEDFAAARASGRLTWLTCVGTPATLSPNPGAVASQHGTGLPEFARYPPTDPVAWADEVLNFVFQMEQDYGFAPDCLEIWNEPDRLEWFKGTDRDLIELYLAAAGRIHAVRPDIRVGGPGLAGYSSTMGGAESMLFALVRNAAAAGAPLDFVSWHHYATSTELQFSQMPSRLKELGGVLGMKAFATVISEWNIYPSAEGVVGPEFDGPHAAANLGGFLLSARLAGLDHGLFFLDQDEDNNPGLTDLMGLGLGLVTEHGIRKPSARLLTILQGMARQPQAACLQSDSEWNVRVTASRDGDVLRIAVTNDVVSGLWVFANRARQHGMEPGWLYPIWLAAGGPRATEQDLVNAGLTVEQAQATLSFIPEVLLFDQYRTQPRPVRIQLLGSQGFLPGPAVRFTPTVNAPAQHVAALQPHLQAANDYAALAGATAGSEYLLSKGYLYTPAELLAITGDFFVWAQQEGIPYGWAVVCWKTMQDEDRNSSLALEGLLNSLPETAVLEESSAAAGVSIVGRELQFSIEPDTSIVLQIRMMPNPEV